MSEPPLTDEQVQFSLRHWREDMDTCRDDPTLFTYDLMSHLCSEDECGDKAVIFGIPPWERYKLEADSYIRVLAAKYPFQLRKAFALGRWHAFLEMYAATKSQRKAMRAI